MSVRVRDRDIERVILIDDNPSVRELYGDFVDELELESVPIEDPIESLDQLILGIDSMRDGVICDYHLNNTSYSSVNGDEIVTMLYKKSYPALLCSRASEAAYSVRRLRRYIPNVISAIDLNPEIVVECFEVCIAEFEGVFRPNRKPYQTLIRIENKEEFRDDRMKLSAVIPGWDTTRMIDIIMHRNDTPLYDDIKSRLDAGDDYRAFATVNLGTEVSDEIYICDWKSL